jgi:Kef-type K+ transport system membrane component KefB
MDWLYPLTSEPFYELAFILFLAALLGALGKFMKQPLIVTFIVLGIIVGPSVLDVVHSKDNIYLLAEVGISILLFIVGLKLDLRLIKSMGKVALTTGLGQVLFTSAIGYLIAIWLGFNQLHSFYIAVALTFSSTIIIVKLLSDKKEIESLHGQISIGFLIVQDVVVIMVMIVLSAISQSEATPIAFKMVSTLFLSILFVGFTLAMMKWVIPRITFYLAGAMELLSLFAIAWAITLASLGEIIGFSAEVGAFLAGVSLASSPFKEAISSRLTSIRDFMLLFFFVNLGANLNLEAMGGQIVPAIIFSIFVLIGNPLIVLIIMGIMGYRKRTAFLAGLTVAQISEFSLIFAGLGLQIGHLDENIVGLITLVGLITIGTSTYLIIYSYNIYEMISPALSIFEKKITTQNENLTYKAGEFELIIFGIGRFGSKLANYLEERTDIHYLGVDFDPATVKKWQGEGRPIMHGDLEDPDILDQIPWSKAKCILSTIPDVRQSTRLIEGLKEKKFEGKVFVTATQEKEMDLLQQISEEQVLMPQRMAAENFYNTYLSKIFKTLTTKQNPP